MNSQDFVENTAPGQEHWLMSACPHDTSGRPEQWYFFTAALSQKIGYSIRFQLALDFPDFRNIMATLDLVYARPDDALELVISKNFIPVARFQGCSDEGVVVTRADHPLELYELPKKTGACTPSVITNVVKVHLQKMGFQVGTILDAPSWSAALSLLLKGEVDFAILYRDFFDELQTTTRQQLVLLTQSQEKKLFHTFLLNPTRAPLQAPVSEALLSLHEDSRGALALRSLGWDRLVPVTTEEVLAFGRIERM